MLIYLLTNESIPSKINNQINKLLIESATVLPASEEDAAEEQRRRLRHLEILNNTK